MKQLRKEDLLQKLDDIGFKFGPTEPYLHQLVCLVLGVLFPQFMYLLDMGTGKTLVLLYLLRHFLGEGKQALVLVPSAVNVESWVKQIKIHAPDLSYQKLIGSAAERSELIETDADLCLMNYKGLEVYMTELVKGKKGKQKHVPVDKKVRAFVQRFSRIVMDESHKLGSAESLVYRLANRVAKNCDVRYGSTGTLFGRDPMKSWSQFRIVDGGETLGETLAMFRQATCNGKANFWGGIDWKFRPESEALVHRMIQHRSIRYEDSECGDLPKLVEQIVGVDLSTEAKLYYNRAIQNLKEARGNYQSLNNPFLRLRQITAGFVGLQDEDDERAEIVFEDNQKLEALEGLLENVPVGSKVIVFHEYRMSGKLIEEVFKMLNIKYAVMSGNAKNPIKEYNRFLDDASCHGLIANTASGGTGVDALQTVSRYVVSYELPVNPSDFKQARKRVHRTGQKGRVYHYILQARGTVDEKVKKFIDEGRNLFSSVVEGKAQLELLK